MSSKRRVYVDGIWDLFHTGHLRMIRKAKRCLGDEENVFLIVGVVGDEVATEYKRKPISDESDRAEIVRAFDFVDQVIVPTPLVITLDFVTKYNIQTIVHGFADDKDKSNFMKRHSDVLEKVPGIFMELEYTHGVSTSDIMRICRDRLNEMGGNPSPRSDEWLSRQRKRPFLGSDEGGSERKIRKADENNDGIVHQK